MSGRVTIRGGVVFVASDAILQNVSIFDAQVICPTNKADLEALYAAINDRAAGNVTIQGCQLVPYTAHVEKQFRSAAAKAEASAGPDESDVPSWIRDGMELMKKGD